MISIKMDTKMNKYCTVCHKDTNKRCSKCKITKYCSRECQKSDWFIHKAFCAEAPTISSAKAPTNAIIEEALTITDDEVISYGISMHIPRGYAPRPNQFPICILDYLKSYGYTICADEINYGGRDELDRKTYECMKCGICHIAHKFGYSQYNSHKLSILHRFEYKKGLCAIQKKLTDESELILVTIYIEAMNNIEKALTHKENPTKEDIFVYYLLN